MVVVGGGVVGLGLGMMLAHDDHAVTLLERDNQPAPDDAEEAWTGWERKGVNQSGWPIFLARYRQIIERELPRSPPTLDQDGAVRFNPVSDAPDFITGGPRDGDDRFQMLSGRRAVVERSVASVAEQTPGLRVRRGVTVRDCSAGRK